MDRIITLTAINSRLDTKSFGWAKTIDCFTRQFKPSRFEESRYDYIVFEEWNYGVTPESVEETWFEIRDDDQWIEIPKPKEFEGIVSFAFGY